VASLTATAGDLHPRQSVRRLLFVDNLRWTTILLVVSMHAADTYSPLGTWYFVDRRPLALPELIAFAAWQMYLQAFFMGLLFFIAGFFVPPSFDRKGPRTFIRDRAFRLGLPVFFYMFVLGLITEYFIAHSWTSTEPSSFLNEWIKHIRNGQFLQENGPLWFCLALLIFSAFYVVIRVSRISFGNLVAAPATAQLTAFAVLMAALAFLLRLVLPPGFAFLNMHLGDFSQYILLFVAGVLAARGRWLLRLNSSLALRWLLIVLPFGFVAWLSLMITGGALKGNSQAYLGGWHWQAAAIDVWEAFTCVALCYGLLTLFERKFDSQGWFAKFLSDNAFCVYVFHPPIVIVTARMLHRLAVPAIPKFVILTLLAAAASFILSAGVFRRVPLLQRIL
jgi:glucans biosynthesis protein C